MKETGREMTAPVIFITFFNIGFFMVVQIFFFYFIASKQIDVIVESKADIINKYSESSELVRNYIKSYLATDEFKRDKKNAAEIEEERMRLNRKIIWKRTSIFLIPVSIVIIISIGVIIYCYIRFKKRYT